MNAGILPLVLISAAIGMALTAANRSDAWASYAVFATTAIIMRLLPLPFAGDGPVVTGLLLSGIVTAGLVFLPGALSRGLAIAIAANGGFWLGSAAALSDLPFGVALALPFALLFIPGKALVDQQLGVVAKVLSSWLIAVALLSLFVSLVPTPGYKPDHME